MIFIIPEGKKQLSEVSLPKINPAIQAKKSRFCQFIVETGQNSVSIFYFPLWLFHMLCCIMKNQILPVHKEAP